MQFSELIFIHDVCVCAGVWLNYGFDAVYEDGAGLLNALARRFVDLEVVDETFIARCVARIGLPVDFLVTRHLVDFPITIVWSSGISSSSLIASCSGILWIASFVLLWTIAFLSLRITSADVCIMISFSPCGASGAECRGFLRVITPTATTWF